MFIGILSNPIKFDAINTQNECRLIRLASLIRARRRTSTENAVPNNPENSANIKYNVPISLAFVDKNQRSNQMLIDELTNFLGLRLRISLEEVRLSSSVLLLPLDNL